VNEIDTFQFQVTGVTGVTQTLSYTWQISGVSANVNQSSSLTGGSATIVVRDAAGQIVHQMDLSNDGTFESLPGQTGAWTVQVVLSDLDGTLNFRLEKRT